MVTSESQFLVLAHDFVPPSSRTERDPSCAKKPYSIKKARNQMWDPSPSSRLRMTANDECSVNCRDRIYQFTSHRSLFTLSLIPARRSLPSLCGCAGN